MSDKDDDNVLGFPHGFNGDGNTNVIEFTPTFGLRPNDQVDMINSPPHYNQQGLEAYQILEHVALLYAANPVLVYHIVTVLKYLLRAPFKHATPLSDFNKARWHLNRAIEVQAGYTNADKT